jgi:hypothetical protein
VLISQVSIPQFVDDNWLNGERLGGGSFRCHDRFDHGHVQLQQSQLSAGDPRPDPRRRGCQVEDLELSAAGAFSSEVDAGSREENASKQKSRASVLIQPEPKL